MPDLLPIVDEPSGLRALIVLDDTTLGPAVGGVRTLAYASDDALEADARRLARAMTVKCALAGLDAGGGKIVVDASRLRDRRAAFVALGAAVDALGGRLLTAGDYGTTAEDLEAMASRTAHVHTDALGLGAAVARGLVACAGAAMRAVGRTDLRGRTALVQGTGTIGAAVVHALTAAGVRVLACDPDEDRLAAVVRASGATSVPIDAALSTEVELLVPCARGGVLDEVAARTAPVRAVVGGANNVLATEEAGRLLAARGVREVPDTISSAGAVILGVSRRLMGVDPDPLIDALGLTAEAVLDEARATGRPPGLVAIARAEGRIRGGR